MPGALPINANPIKLLAYSTAGLPVTYSVVSGEGVVEIIQQPDGYYVYPRIVGEALIRASSAGNQEYADALPEDRTVYVIEHPDYSDPVFALEVDATTRPDPVVADVLNPPVPPEFNDIIASPLESTDLEAVATPNAPSECYLLFIPFAPSNVSGADYSIVGTDKAPSFVEAGVIVATIPPADVVASLFAAHAPSVNYALNISTYTNYSEVSFDIESNLEGETISSVFVQKDGDPSVVSKFNDLSDQTYGGKQLTHLVGDYTYTDRSSLDVGTFKYSNLSNPDYDGTYEGPYYGAKTGLNRRWWQYWIRTKKQDVDESNYLSRMFLRPFAVEVNCYLFDSFFNKSIDSEVNLAINYVHDSYQFNQWLSRMDNENYGSYRKVFTKQGYCYGFQKSGRAADGNAIGYYKVIPANLAIKSSGEGFGFQLHEFSSERLDAYLDDRTASNPNWKQLERNKAMDLCLKGLNIFPAVYPYTNDSNADIVYSGDTFSPFPENDINNPLANPNPLAIKDKNITLFDGDLTTTPVNPDSPSAELV